MAVFFLLFHNVFLSFPSPEPRTVQLNPHRPTRQAEVEATVKVKAQTRDKDACVEIPSGLDELPVCQLSFSCVF